MGEWYGVFGDRFGWTGLDSFGLFGSEWNAMVMIPPCECFDSASYRIYRSIHDLNYTFIL